MGVSTRIPRARDNVSAVFNPARLLVSVHAPHAGGDPPRRARRTAWPCFNPRPSCEGRLAITTDNGTIFKFQSTPLMRGATALTWQRRRRWPGFNPRPSCEGRRRLSRSPQSRLTFQSTPLMRGATRSRFRSQPARPCFNPRPSCEGRQTSSGGTTRRCTRFNPRPSCEGRRGMHLARRHDREVSIHAPHARGDRSERYSSWASSGFNPRPSCEGRPGASGSDHEIRVSIHAPHARGDKTPSHEHSTVSVSIHAPHARGDSYLLHCDK